MYWFCTNSSIQPNLGSTFPIAGGNSFSEQARERDRRHNQGASSPFGFYLVVGVGGCFDWMDLFVMTHLVPPVSPGTPLKVWVIAL